MEARSRTNCVSYCITKKRKCTELSDNKYVNKQDNQDPSKIIMSFWKRIISWWLKLLRRVWVELFCLPVFGNIYYFDSIKLNASALFRTYAPET